MAFDLNSEPRVADFSQGPPGVDFYVGRLERGERFAFVKRTEGFWDLLVAAAEEIPAVAELLRDVLDGRRSGTELVPILEQMTPEQAERLENHSRYKHFWAEGFITDCVRDLQSPHGSSDYFEASMVKVLPQDGSQGARRDVFQAFHTSGRPLHNAYVWKEAVQRNQFHDFVGALRPYRVVMVGPSHVSTLGTSLELDSFEYVGIHPLTAIGDREEILGTLRQRVCGDAGENTVVLFQAGSLAYWLIYRLWEESPAFLIDVGQAIDPWAPPSTGELKWFVKRAVAFSEERESDIDFVGEALGASREANYWTNFAPVSLRLERRIADLLELPPEKTVVAVANGTLALHGLVNLAAYRSGRPLRWIVSAFSFPSQRQGPLGRALVVDCDEQGFLDLASVERLAPETYDGIIVTNLFGCAAPISDWEALAARHDKKLLFDSATCLYSTFGGVPIGRFGDGEAFSFHGTNPLGIGEGGCVVIPRADEDEFRSLINFGLYKHIDTGALSMNGKMSDVAAAFILARLTEADAVRDGYRAQFDRVTAIAGEVGLRPLVTPEHPTGLPSLVPLLAPRLVRPAELVNPVLGMQKAYPPLDSDCSTATDLYERTVCVPCHRDVSRLADGEVEALLKGLT